MVAIVLLFKFKTSFSSIVRANLKRVRTFERGSSDGNNTGEKSSNEKSCDDMQRIFGDQSKGAESTTGTKYKVTIVIFASDGFRKIFTKTGDYTDQSTSERIV